MWRVKRRGMAVAAVLGLLVSLAPKAGAADKVTYLLPAPLFLPAFGPWMVAQQRGYYAAEGLEVDFAVAKGGADVAKQVGIGNAVIGGAMGDTPIIVRANGVPIRAVAVLGSGSLMQLVLHADSSIKSPADLRGKVVTVSTFQETTYYALLGVIAKVGLSKNDVDIQAAGATNIWKLFLAGKADAMAAVPDWIVDVTQAGAKITIIPSDEYFPSMAQAVLASDTTIKEKSALVHRLVRATLHGMRDIMDDPTNAARDYVKSVPERTGQEAQMAEVFALYNKYVYRNQRTLGAMDAKRLADLQKFYVAQGIVERASPVADLYTNEFVK